MPQAPGSLNEALDALEADHDFMLKGDVFTPEVIQHLDRVQACEGSGADVTAAASVRVLPVLRRLGLSLLVGAKVAKARLRKQPGLRVSLSLASCFQ